MAMAPDQIDELEKMVKKARQKPLPFGLCLGKKPEDNVMVMDLKKSPEVLMRKAKADGETGKLTYGTADVKGKIMTLCLEGKMLPGLAKNMKMFMNKQVTKMKVIITDADGNELESDGDENEIDGEWDDGNDAELQEDAIAADTDTNAPEDEDQPAAQIDDPAAAQWSKVSTALDPLVEEFSASNHKKAAAIATAWNGAKAAADNGDMKTAMAVAAKVKPIVTGASDGSDDEKPVDPNEAKWTAERSAMETLYTDAMGKKPENRSKLQAAWAIAIEKAEGGDFVGGLNILQRLKPSLEAVLNAGDSGQNTEIPKDVVPFQKSRILWSSTKSKMRKELETLVGAITAACAGDEELADIATEAPALLKNLEVFDEELETILDDITQTAEGPDRDKLKSAAVRKISQYQNALQSGFFADVDSNNGFTNVSVTSAATASLGQISKVLAA